MNSNQNIANHVINRYMGRIVMIKLKNIFMQSKLAKKSINYKTSALQTCDNNSIISADKPSFEQLMCFYVDGKQARFPISFSNKDEYFKKGVMFMN